ncbi:hypothetical protein CRG98_011529 [Punica granatum]|uniref:Endonuclease/exonuclease/phosphatase domain-containing protein n=1 Tax=Punica granatum TaxID=22663 RepID=A0A2I0KID0_PUNGR|nr:hypothetical protein CRG98_011529 [Punica granatum]
MKSFTDMLDDCAFTDLGFSGPCFTWSNLRSSSELNQERLDGALANPSWRLKFPEAHVFRLPRPHSNHCPLVLTLNLKSAERPARPFHLETVWFSHEGFMPLVFDVWKEAGNEHSQAVTPFQEKVRHWNKNTFGNIFLRKKNCLARLAGIQRALKTMVHNHFSSLFTTDFHSSDWATQDIARRRSIGNEHASSLAEPVSRNEIKRVLFSIKPYKAPGPNGLHACFYQRSWDIRGGIGTENSPAFLQGGNSSRRPKSHAHCPHPEDWCT